MATWYAEIRCQRMYEAFYGFREKPFHVTADPTFLFPSRHHQEAMAHLLYGVRERLGFIMITGEVGPGKTTLAKALVHRLEGPVRTALILNPSYTGPQLLRAVLRDFGLLPNPEAQGPHSTRTLPGKGELLARLEQFLLHQAERGGNAALILDEAQALSVSALEQVRLLSNVETPKRKLLQIVLLGQPELTQRLASDTRLRALQQRVAVRYQIQPLEEQEVAEYIRHRLHAAGFEPGPLFTEGAVNLIARAAHGIPRQINLLCDQALLAGFVRETRQINETIVDQVLSSVTEEVT